MRQFLRGMVFELRRRRGGFAGLTIIAMLLALLLAWQWDYRYRSEAVMAVHGVDTQTVEFVRAELGALRNRLNPAELEQAWMDTITVIPRPLPNLVTLRLDASSPKHIQNQLSEVLQVLTSPKRPARPPTLDDDAEDLLTDIESLEQELAELDREVATLRDASDVTADFAAYEARVRETRELIEDLEVNINANSARIDALKLQLENEQGVVGSQQALRDLDAQEAKLLASIEALRTEGLDEGAGLVSMQQELDNLRVARASLREASSLAGGDSSAFLSQLRQQLSAQELERSGLDSRYRSLRGRLQEEVSRAGRSRQLAADIDVKIRSRDSAQSRLERLRDELGRRDAAQLQAPQRTRWLSIESMPSAPQLADGKWPRRILWYTPAVCLLLIIVVCISLLVGDKRVRSIATLRRELRGEFAVLGTVPPCDSPPLVRERRGTLAGWCLAGLALIVMYSLTAISLLEAPYVG